MRATIWKMKQAAACVAAAAAVVAMVTPLGSDVSAQEGGSLPAGVRVWNGDVMAPYRDFDFDGGAVPLAPITIIGVRNGSFSGKIVVGSTRPIRNLRARTSDLTAGRGRIPASAVRVSYPPYSAMSVGKRAPRGVSLCDDLLPAPAREIPPVSGRRIPGHVKPNMSYQPVWITVRVPDDSPPGEYTGSLELSMDGARSVKAAVKLKVHGWSLPKGENYATFTELIHSPESAALQYGVPLWSDRHFELMGKALDLMGEVGSRSVYIPLICDMNLGNGETMVRWVEKGKGAYRYDFTVMEKYLDVVEKRMGRPRLVVLHVWDIFLESGPAPKTWSRTGDSEYTLAGKGPEVSLLKNGKLGRLMLPKYSDAARSEALWTPLMTELRGRLKKRGLDQRAMLGLCGDFLPNKRVLASFARMMPGAPWVVHSHGYNYARKDFASAGTSLGCTARVIFNYQTVPAKSLYLKPPGKTITTDFNRNLFNNSPILNYRLLGEIDLAAGQAGFSRMGADFWPVLKDKRGRKVGRLSGHLPKNNWRNLDIRMTLLAPGPEGAVPTARFEMLREGVQECEARLFIEKALAGGRLPAALAGKCRALLKERHEGLLLSYPTYKDWNQYRYVSSLASTESYEAYLKLGWQKRSDGLYSAAAEVARAVGR